MPSGNLRSLGLATPSRLRDLRAGGWKGPLLWAFGLLLGVAGCGEKAAPLTASAPASAAQQSVLLFAAASTGPVLDEIRAEFRKVHPEIEVRSNYAATSTLARQIEQGAEADLFLSANQKWVDFLVEKELVAAQQDLLGNTLVIAVPADSRVALTRPEDLLDPQIERLALADPEAVPAGIYAKQALTKLDLWEQLRSKVAAADNVQQALAFVASGAAQAAIVYETDAAVSRSVRVALRIDPKLSEPIRYPLALLKHGAGGAGARELYRFLLSPEAAVIFRRHRFTVLTAPGPAEQSR
jgi:molybdate transport system substrate-binding protein